MTSGLALLALFLKVLLFVVVVLFFSTTQFVTAVPRVRIRHGERIDVLAKQTMDLKYVLVDEEYEERFLNETMQRDGNENDTDDKELHSQTRMPSKYGTRNALLRRNASRTKRASSSNAAAFGAPRWRRKISRKIGDETGNDDAVSYTHLTLPTKRIV